MKKLRERAAVAGYGSIGKQLVETLAAGIPGLTLSAVATRRVDDVQKDLDERGIVAKAVDFKELPEVAELVVECTSSSLLPEIAEPMLRAGKDVVVSSCGALLTYPALITLAEEPNGGRILVPTGALLGLDAVAASALAENCMVRIASAKPPRALAGAPFFDIYDVDLESLTEPTKLYEGRAREVAVGFPANLNVIAALAMAGIGPDRTEAEVWADPALDTNQHTITVESDAARITMQINNRPSENLRTGRITVLSITSLLRKRHASLVIGS